jgi:integrase
MKVSQVNLLSRTIRLEPGTTKNGEGREVSMTKSVYELLAGCVSGKGADDYVFTRPDGNAVRDFRELWRNACVAADIPNLLFHDLRRTAARARLKQLRPDPLRERQILRPRPPLQRRVLGVADFGSYRFCSQRCLHHASLLRLEVVHPRNHPCDVFLHRN